MSEDKNLDDLMTPTLTVEEEQFLHQFSCDMDRAATLLRRLNARWWVSPATGQPIVRNVGEMLMLQVTEIAEAMEGWRKNLPDDKLPHHPMLTVEIADCMIRQFDMCGGLGLSLGAAFREKIIYNLSREDHKLSARLKEGGKKV